MEVKMDGGYASPMVTQQTTRLENYKEVSPSTSKQHTQSEISAIFSDLSWFEPDVSDPKRFGELISRGRKLSDGT